MLLTRKHLALWQTSEIDESGLRLSHPAQRIREYLQAHGASFYTDIAHGCGVLPTQAEEGLSELVSAGLVSADSFSGLRALVMPMDRKRKLAARGLRIARFGLEDAGRWSLLRRSATATVDDRMQQLAFILLRRYGVVFRKLLINESAQLPPWHEMLRVFRQLEAQGLIRGGRFVGGVTGEQYALPEAVTALRTLRKQPHDGQIVSLSAADPLNLSGVLMPGPRIPSLISNRLLLRDGVLIASQVGGQTELHVEFTPAAEWQARNVLLHKRMPGLVMTTQ